MTAKPSVICHSDVLNTSCTHLPFWIPTASSAHSSAVTTDDRKVTNPKFRVKKKNPSVKTKQTRKINECSLKDPVSEAHTIRYTLLILFFNEISFLVNSSGVTWHVWLEQMN